MTIRITTGNMPFLLFMGVKQSYL